MSVIGQMDWQEDLALSVIGEVSFGIVSGILVKQLFQMGVITRRKGVVKNLLVLCDHDKLGKEFQKSLRAERIISNRDVKTLDLSDKKIVYFYHCHGSTHPQRYLTKLMRVVEKCASKDNLMIVLESYSPKAIVTACKSGKNPEESFERVQKLFNEGCLISQQEIGWEEQLSAFIAKSEVLA